MTKFETSYNFKSISQEDYETLHEKYSRQGESKDEFYARVKNEFEFPGITVVNKDTGETKVSDVKKFAKRKSVKVELQSLDSLSILANAGVPAEEIEFYAAGVNKVIADYVKAQFIEAFEPVGDHSLKTILEYQAQTGNRGGFSVDEDTYKAAVASFKDIMAVAMGNPKAAEMLATIAKARFTPSAVSRAGLTISEEVAAKLELRVDQWGSHLNENAPNLADEYAAVHGLWISNIKKLTKQSAALNLEDVL